MIDGKFNVELQTFVVIKGKVSEILKLKSLKHYLKLKKVIVGSVI